MPIALKPSQSALLGVVAKQKRTARYQFYHNSALLGLPNQCQRLSNQAKTPCLALSPSRNVQHDTNFITISLKKDVTLETNNSTFS
jgi:hypothetical protein